MVNAMKVLMEFDGMLPPDEVPEKTEGREGFYHLNEADLNEAGEMSRA